MIKLCTHLLQNIFNLDCTLNNSAISKTYQNVTKIYFFNCAVLDLLIRTKIANIDFDLPKLKQFLLDKLENFIFSDECTVVCFKFVLNLFLEYQKLFDISFLTKLISNILQNQQFKETIAKMIVMENEYAFRITSLELISDIEKFTNVTNLQNCFFFG